MNSLNIKIHDLGNYISHNYVLETTKGFIVIDTGYLGGCEKFVTRFQKIAPLNEIKYIVLTHAHNDHAGFLKDLMNVCDAQVILSPLAVPVLAEGENPINEGAGYSSRLASMFGLFVKDFKFPPVELGERGIYFLGDDYQLFMEMGLPIQIVSLPGHTPDSLGLILTESKQLFCGDAAMNAVISVAKHTIWIDDREQFQASWDKIISMDISKIYPSHGTPFSPKALIKNRHFLDTRKLFLMNK